MTDDSDDRRRRRLLYRSTHRGTREADLILGGFVRAHLADLSSGEFACLERLLEESDPDLMAWIGRGVPPLEYDIDLFKLIVKFKNHQSRH